MVGRRNPVVTSKKLNPCCGKRFNPIVCANIDRVDERHHLGREVRLHAAIGRFSVLNPRERSGWGCRDLLKNVPTKGTGHPHHRPSYLSPPIHALRVETMIAWCAMLIAFRATNVHAYRTLERFESRGCFRLRIDVVDCSVLRTMFTTRPNTVHVVFWETHTRVSRRLGFFPTKLGDLNLGG
jgi:hypothetical protein